MLLEIIRQGRVESVDVDLSMDNLTLREAARLQAALPAYEYEAILNNEPVTPSARVLQALVWAKLAAHYPDIGLEDFDLELEQFAPDDIPMTVHG